MAELFDVIAVSFATRRVKVIEAGKTAANAEAIIKMAVARRGVEDCFYTPAPAGQYRDNDEYSGAPSWGQPSESDKILTREVRDIIREQLKRSAA